MSDLSDSALCDAVAAEVDEAFHYMALCVPGAEVHFDADFRMIVTGLPHSLGNMVLRCTLSGEQLRAKVAAVVKRFRENGLPMGWFLNTELERQNLAPLLLDEEFERTVEFPAMVAPLQDLGRVRPDTPDCKIQEVLTLESLEVWMDVLQRVFKTPEGLSPLFTSPLTLKGMGPDQPLRYFIASVSGVAVGVSAAYCHGSVAGIYCVGTLEEARGRGVGSAVTFAAMETSAQTGMTRAILQASPLGGPVYKRLGFRPVGMHQRWAPKKKTG